VLGPCPKITSVGFCASVRSCLCSAHPRFIIGSGWLSGRKKCHYCHFCGYTMSERDGHLTGPGTLRPLPQVKPAPL